MYRFLFFIFCFNSVFLSTLSQKYTSQNNTSKSQSLEDEVDSIRKLLEEEFYKKNYDKAIEYGERGLEIAENINYYKKYVSTASFLGSAYLNVEDTLMARITFTKSIDVANKLGDSKSKIISQIDGANFYALQDNVKSKRKAIELYKSSIPLAESTNDFNSLLILHLNITEILIDLQEIKTANQYANETKKYITDSTFIGFIGSRELNAAKLYYYNENYLGAIKNIDASERIFRKLNYTEGLIDVYSYRSLIYKNLRNYNVAYSSMVTLDSLKEAQYKNDKINAIETVTAKFKLADINEKLERQQEVSKIREQEAKRETTFLWIKIATGILFFFSIFILYSYLKRKKLVVDLTKKNKQYLKAKENSERLSKAKSILFSNITHELRTPMYGIIGISNMLLNEKEYQHSNIKSLKFSAEYLLTLINNILLFNRFDSGTSPLMIQSKKSNLDIRELVQNAINLSKYLSEKQPNNYNVNIDDSIPKIVVGNRIEISQILINLLANSSKFTNNGEISITINSTHIDDSTLDLHFIISDNGVGISEDKLKIIFNEYSQIGEGEEFMGTGLGLPIVKKLLLELGKDLILKSTLGKGTTVSFSMPFSISKKNNDKIVEDYTFAKPFKDKKILIVDDNKINLLVSRKFIENYGGSATTIDNGIDAIELEKEGEFDLILMDINMPIMNGFETASNIRENNLLVPIIALTAVERGNVTGQESFSLMNDIIIKPFDTTKVIPLLLKYLK